MAEDMLESAAIEAARPELRAGHADARARYEMARRRLLAARADLRAAEEETRALWEMAHRPLVSIVTACFNEEQNVRHLYERVRDVLDREGEEFELIFVDDGSRDGTFAELQRLHAQDPRVRVVRLVRNFGHQAALTAGLHAARGEAVVTMDADLQHPPEVLPELLRAWRSGYDIVYAVRDGSVGTPRLKRWTSRLFYWFIRRISEVDLPPNAADFRLISRSVLEVINSLPERSRLLRGLVHWTGYAFTLVPYHEGARHAGTTKYTWKRMFNLCVDSVTAFSTLPLRVSTFVGAASAAAAALYALGAIVIRLFVPSIAVDGWASVLVSVLFLGGIQLLALGLIGEYIGRIFQEAKQRPLYLVRDRLGISADERPHDDADYSHARPLAVPPARSWPNPH